MIVQKCGVKTMGKIDEWDRRERRRNSLQKKIGTILLTSAVSIAIVYGLFLFNEFSLRGGGFR